LKPLDLLALSRTNKEFRTIVLAPSTRGVWIAARKPFRIPDPPSHISEVRWASFLFETTCHVRDDSLGHSLLNAYIEKRHSPAEGRACLLWIGNSSSASATVANAISTFGETFCVLNSCSQSSLVYQPKLKKQYPQYEAAMFDYMLFTNISAHTQRSKSKFFWDKDIIAHGEKWNEVKKTITNTDCEAFEVWKQERLDYIESVAKVSTSSSFSLLPIHPPAQAREMCKKAEVDLYNLTASDSCEDRRQRLNA